MPVPPRVRLPTLMTVPSLKLVSRPGESEGDFRARLSLALREQRDAAMKALQQRYAPKVAQLRDRLAPEGRILISYILADPPPRRALWRLATLAARVSRSDWRPEYGDVFVARHEIGCIHFEHRFTPQEIEAEAHAAGLRVAFHAQTSDGSLALVA